MFSLLAWGIAFSLAVTMGLVIRGFLFIAVARDGTAVYHLGRGVVLILLALALRALYWDGLPLLFNAVDPGAWAAWSSAVGKPIPNILTGLVALAGTRHMLILQWLLIPEAERHRYNILTAPFYPQRALFVRGVDTLRRRWRDGGKDANER